MQIPQARVELALSGLQPPVITVIRLGVNYKEKEAYLKLIARFLLKFLCFFLL